MSPENIAASVVRRHPEFQTFGRAQLRLVKKALTEAAILADPDILTPEETDQFMKELVPDAGTPAAALRAYRYRAELTQRKLAKKCGIPQPHLSAMEHGARPIGLKVAKKLAAALDVDYRRLV